MHIDLLTPSLSTMERLRPRLNVGVRIPNSKGHTKAWESITPTRGASNVEERTVNRLSSIAPEG